MTTAELSQTEIATFAQQWIARTELGVIALGRSFADPKSAASRSSLAQVMALWRSEIVHDFRELNGLRVRSIATDAAITASVKPWTFDDAVARLRGQAPAPPAIVTAAPPAPGVLPAIRSISIDDVIAIVCESYATSRERLLSHRRDRAVTVPRQLGMYLCWKLTDGSLPQIALAFRKKDHTTAMYARDKIQDRVDTDSEFAAHVAELEQILRNRLEARNQERGAA